MIKFVHLSAALLTIMSFISRFLLLQFKPELLQKKYLKILPHIIDTLLLITGSILIVQGNWLAGNFTWIIVKLGLLIAYIILGIKTMRCAIKYRWLMFAGALSCYAMIIVTATHKSLL